MKKQSNTTENKSDLYQDRWSSYGENSGIIEISEKPTALQLQQFDIFSEYDSAFLEKISPDISIAIWKKNAVLFEEGSYINLAFYVVKGSIEISLQKKESSALGIPIFDSERTVAITRETMNKDQTLFQAQIEKQKSSKNPTAFLSNLDIDLPLGGSQILNEGEIFGEIGALSGWPQSVTARTKSECRLVQIRIPALRMMRRKSSALKDKLNLLYKERALFSQLQATPLLQGCTETFITTLMDSVELVSCDPDEVIAKEGTSADGFFIVRSGFVKLSQKISDGNIAVSYLSKGMTFGESEHLLEGVNTWLVTATSKEYSELVKIPKHILSQITQSYPAIEQRLWESSIARIKETGKSRRNIQQSEFISTALNRGLVGGNSILVIDLNVCTRCDDCVRGCAETHGGTPRFIREGEKYQNFLITRACYHCQDPVCLVGCPTGAIHRASVGSVVEISDALCIGCQSCANACPYDAIVMVDTGKKTKENEVLYLATKCDLCHTSKEGPACVNACPHGCATRIESLDAFQNLIAGSGREGLS
jgi:Fe-S-cluster-containing dehydrogenase component/CRP-like cAMP-binding protein